MRKRILAVMGVTVMVLGMTTSVGAEEAKADASGKTFAAITTQEDQFNGMLNTGMQKACEDYNAECVSAMSGGDETKERSMLDTYCTQEVDGVCIMPTSNISSPATLAAVYNEYSIPLAIADGEIEQDGIIGGSTTSHTELGYGAGKLAVEYIEANKERYEDTIKIGVITFKTQYAEPASDRMNNFLKALDEAEIAYEVEAEGEAWVQDSSLQVTGDMLTANSDLDIIFACNDGGTIGAVQAVKNAGLGGQIKVFGIDCGEQQIDMLRSDDDILQGVAAQDAYGMGYKAMEKLIQYSLDDYDFELGEIEVCPATPVSRMSPESIDDFETLLKETM